MNQDYKGSIPGGAETRNAVSTTSAPRPRVDTAGDQGPRRLAMTIRATRTAAENVTKAQQTLSLAVDDLREALNHSDSVSAIILLDMLRDCAGLADRAATLLNAMNVGV